MAFSYPLQLHPCRNSVSQLIFHQNALELSTLQYYGLTYGITGLSWVVAMVVTSLGVVLAVVGATGTVICGWFVECAIGLWLVDIGSTAISYILPATFYYFLFHDAHPTRYFGVCVVPFALSMVFW